MIAIHLGAGILDAHAYKDECSEVTLCKCPKHNRNLKQSIANSKSVKRLKRLCSDALAFACKIYDKQESKDTTSNDDPIATEQKNTLLVSSLLDAIGLIEASGIVNAGSLGGNLDASGQCPCDAAIAVMRRQGPRVHKTSALDDAM